MENYLVYANSSLLWVLAIPVALICAFQAVIFYRKAVQVAPLVELSKEDAQRAFKIGAVAAIGPAFGVFVVMLGLMAKIGAPLSWMRLSVIGAAPTELAAATQAANAMKITLESADYSLIHFANAAWVMALNGSAWLLTTGLFTHKLDQLVTKVSSKDPKAMMKIALPAMCGAFAFFLGRDILKGISNEESYPILVAASASAISMVILDKLAKKYPKLTEYNLGIAMVIGMASAVIYTKVKLLIQ